MSFNLVHYFRTYCAIFWLEYCICVLPHQRCACSSIFSSPFFFCILWPELLKLLPCFLWISRKINPLNTKTFSYVRAYACILQFTGLSVIETAKKLDKSKCWVVKWSWGSKGFEDKKQRRRPKVLNKAGKIVLKKARYKKGDSTRKLSHSLITSQVQKGLWKAV